MPISLQHRKAHLFPYCLSTTTLPQIVNFDVASTLGGIIHHGKKPGLDKCPWCPPFKRRTIKTQCFPLYSILQALGNPTVHYLRYMYDLSTLRISFKCNYEIIHIFQS